MMIKLAKVMKENQSLK
jgi:hypothetical protein